MNRKKADLTKPGGTALPSGLHYEKLSGAAGQRTRALWEQIFTEDTEAFLTYYYREKIVDAQIHVLSDESGQIVSMVHANPYTVMLHGTRRKSYYIVGVATAPLYRHRGCMAFLLQKAVLQAKSEGCPFVFLMPVDPAIYEPFGFKYGVRVSVWERSAKLKMLMETPVRTCPAAGSMTSEFTLTAYMNADAGMLAAYAADTLARRYDAYCVHDEAYFDRLSRELASENGALYLLWKRRVYAADNACTADRNGVTDRLCGYFCYACEQEEYLQEVIMEPEAGHLFIEKKNEDRIMLLMLEEGISCGRAYFPEEV